MRISEREMNLSSAAPSLSVYAIMLSSNMTQSEL